MARWGVQHTALWPERHPFLCALLQGPGPRPPTLPTPLCSLSYTPPPTHSHSCRSGTASSPSARPAGPCWWNSPAPLWAKEKAGQRPRRPLGGQVKDLHTQREVGSVPAGPLSQRLPSPLCIPDRGLSKLSSWAPCCPLVGQMHGLTGYIPRWQPAHL